MKRIPEPELMNEASQARAYAEADFSEPNQLFMQLFTEHFPGFDGTTVVDLGCGPADIAIDFALQHPDAKVIGVDGAQSMLEFGNDRIAKTGLAGQVELRCLYLEPETVNHICPSGEADAVISNSLLHHLATPETLWQAINFLGGKGAKILVMDLARPDNSEKAADIVEQYASDEPEILREDFYNSLLAAYTPDEVRGQLDSIGLQCLEVSMSSDRHLLISGELAC
jgi:ubiquinone/menaquinone biosynthesis C-methylase UbiE